MTLREWGTQLSMDERTNLEQDGADDERPAVAQEAENYERNLKLPPDTAQAVAQDLNADATRKPASDDVDRARAAQARATET